jgi:glycosyltransferase involved in cell wall biosynthesis
MSPRVSVVMATYDREQFLRAAIDSALAQTFADFELLVVDDGSREPARTIVGEYAAADARVRPLWLAHCGLPSAVRNAGIRAARGEYVAFLDSDDAWTPDKLEKQLAAFAATPGARWSYTACAHMDEQGRRISPEGIQPWRRHRGRILDEVACLRAHSALPSVMVERTLLIEVGSFDESLPLFEDHDLWLRLASRSEVATVAEPLLLVRRHGAHYSGSEALAVLECRERFLSRAAGFALSPAAHRELRRLRAINLARLACARAGAGERAAALGSLRASMGAGWRCARWWWAAAYCLAMPSRSARA